MNRERRRWVIAGAAMLVAPVVTFAQRCQVTPRDALGPYYKPGAPARGELCASGSGGGRKLVGSGRVFGEPDCAPLAGALVEVWQADGRGDYSQVGAKADDPDCLLRASLKAGADGRYTYTTVLPGEYPGRPRHIHYRISAKGYATLVTQLYFDRGYGIPQALAVTATPKDGILVASFDVTLARR